jgi:hypothetical protein
MPRLANWSSRPRRLLTSAPLWIRTCGTPASRSADHGFTAPHGAPPGVIRCDFGDTLCKQNVLLVFPSFLSRRSDFLPSLPVTYVLRSRYHALLRP